MNKNENKKSGTLIAISTVLMGLGIIALVIYHFDASHLFTLLIIGNVATSSSILGFGLTIWFDYTDLKKAKQNLFLFKSIIIPNNLILLILCISVLIGIITLVAGVWTQENTIPSNEITHFILRSSFLMVTVVVVGVISITVKYADVCKKGKESIFLNFC